MTSLATLLALADSRLPTGGHVHSGGVEEAVTSGLVVDLATLRAFLRRRIRTQGLVTASVAAAVHAGSLTVAAADRETDARTPAPAARQASRAQGRGLARLARRVWPDGDWDALGATPHLAVAAGAVGAASGMTASTHGAVRRVHHDDRLGDGRATAAGAGPRRRRGADVRAVRDCATRPPIWRARSSPTCPTRCSTCWPSATAERERPLFVS